MNKTVLITGCSSGFGKLASKKFHQEGWNVIATMRSPEKETELNQLDNVLVEKLDVNNQQSIKEVVKVGILKFGRVDVLVNNAGYGGFGLFEQMSEGKIQELFNVNVFGLMNVSREVLPIMREQQSGVIINFSSIAGIVATPMNSIYSAAKFAVKGFTESLALEYKPLGIEVKSICPGAFATNFFKTAMIQPERGDGQINKYAAKIVEHRQKASPLNPDDPSKVIDKIWECATQETPTHNIIGNDAEMLVNMRNSMNDQEFLGKLGEMIIPKL